MHVSRPMPLVPVSSATGDIAERISKVDDDVAELAQRQNGVVLTYNISWCSHGMSCSEDAYSTIKGCSFRKNKIDMISNPNFCFNHLQNKGRMENVVLTQPHQ